MKHKPERHQQGLTASGHKRSQQSIHGIEPGLHGSLHRGLPVGQHDALEHNAQGAKHLHKLHHAIENPTLPSGFENLLVHVPKSGKASIQGRTGAKKAKPKPARTTTATTARRGK